MTLVTFNIVYVCIIMYRYNVDSRRGGRWTCDNCRLYHCYHRYHRLQIFQVLNCFHNYTLMHTPASVQTPQPQTLNIFPQTLLFPQTYGVRINHCGYYF